MKKLLGRRPNFAGKTYQMKILLTLVRNLLLIILLHAGGAILRAQSNDAAGKDKLDSLKAKLKNIEQYSVQEKVSINSHIGIFYNMIGMYDSARYYLNEALKFPEGMKFEGGRILVNIGNSYGFQGMYTDAVKYYIKALKVSETNEKEPPMETILKRNNIVRAMGNMSEIYYLMGNQKQAVYYATEARKISEELNPGDPSYLVPQLLYIIASVHLDRGEIDQAEKVAKDMYIITDSILNKIIRLSGAPQGMYLYMAYGEEILAQVCRARKNYDSALEYAGKGLEYAVLQNEPSTIAKVFCAYSDIYIDLKNYNSAADFALKALEVYPDYYKLNPGIAYNAGLAFLLTGNKEEAHKYFTLYSAQMKANTDKQFHETIASMEVEFAVEKKNLRIESLEQQKMLYSYIVIIASFMVIAIGIALGIKIKNAFKEKHVFAANEIFKWEKTERRRLANDVHDSIGGTLSALKHKLMKANVHLPDVYTLIDNCIEDSRRMGYGLMPRMLEERGLKAALEDFCYKFPDVRFYFFGEARRINERLEHAVFFSAYELVNNARKYSGSDDVAVQLMFEEKVLILSVIDKGKGFDEKTVKFGEGLQNIRERVAYFKGNMNITSTPGEETDITIELKIF
jgi:signal transduction histidine kinase